MSLREIRIARGLTQQQVADILNVDRPLINKFENNVCLPTPSVVNKLCELYKCKVKDLFNSEEINFKNIKCAHGQNVVCTLKNSQNRVNTYNYQVRLKKGEFPLFEKNELKKRGFNSHKQFLEWAYKKLEEL